MFTYFFLGLMFFVVWVILFLNRKDLRQKMIISSLAVIPLCFFDYFSQPSYWNPKTFLSIPVGIEGIIFGFAFGGIASVLYEEIANTHFKKYRNKNYNVFSHIVIPVSIILISVVLYIFFELNMMVSLPIGMIFGLFLLITIRPDFKNYIIFSGLYFGVLYLLLFMFWLMFFPDAILWWNLDIYYGLKILGVPFGEVLFGFLYGALWGPLYEFLFNEK